MRIEELIARLEWYQGKATYSGNEKRKNTRLIYPAQKRPILKTGKHHLEVLDVSEGGMRLFNYLRYRLDPSIQGIVAFISGASFEVKGKTIWHYKNELGLIYCQIPRIIIEEEAGYLLRYFQNKGYGAF